jgi:23S rRNA pseudouridine2605 synthase
VQVNGRTVTELGAKADPNHDRIRVDGRPLRPLEEHVYLLLNKPPGVVTTLSDPQGRPTIRDLLPRLKQRVFPVGRLDFRSAGLLLLTNDGDLALRLTHPRYGVRKTYRVKVRGAPAEDALRRLRQGVELPDGRTQPAQVRVLETSERKTWLEIVIAEGKQRQVRRMCEHVGLPVEKLIRTQLGPLRLGKLPPGYVRPLTPEEIAKLHRAAGLASRACSQYLRRHASMSKSKA